MGDNCRKSMFTEQTIRSSQHLSTVFTGLVYIIEKFLPIFYPFVQEMGLQQPYNICYFDFFSPRRDPSQSGVPDPLLANIPREAREKYRVLSRGKRKLISKALVSFHIQGLEAYLQANRTFSAYLLYKTFLSKHKAFSSLSLYITVPLAQI